MFSFFQICKNHEGKTALNMCEHNPKKDWLACTELIRAQLNKPVCDDYLQPQF